MNDTELNYGLQSSTEEIDGEIYKVKKLKEGLMISFNPTGGTVSTGNKYVIDGNSIGTLPTPVKSGYIFNGWYVDDLTGERVLDDYIVTQSTTLYAHWTKTSNVAQIDQTIYDTLQEAIDAAPDNTSTTITLLKNANEIITIDEEKDIDLDLNNKTLSNCGNKAVINNYGIINLRNGNISSSADVGAVDNRTGTLTIYDVNINATGSRQALFVYTGDVTIKGNSYLSSQTSGTPTNSSMGRGTVQCLAEGTITILGGTIVGEKQQAISNEGIVIIGKKDSAIDTSSPIIIGKTYGVKSTGTLKFYDGIIKGKTDTINGIVSDKEVNSIVVNSSEVIDNTTYQTSYLESTE